MAKSFLSTFLSRRQPIRPLSLLPSALNLHMTMTMTLRLAEKVLVQSFGTSKLSARTGSMVLVLFHDQRSRSTSGLRASGVSTFLACLLPECFYPEFMICRWVSSHRSMTVNHFGSSGFRSFKLSSCTFSQSAFTRSRRSFDVCLLESMVDMYSGLWALGVFDPMQPVTYFPSGVPSLQTA
jgi:hypothetical protein